MEVQARVALSVLISVLVLKMTKVPKHVASNIHDKQTGAMRVVPTTQKGGRRFQYLCTEVCRFLVWLGYTVVGLGCEQEPSTLSVLEAVKTTCRGLGIRVIRVLDEIVAPGPHASNGPAEVMVKVFRRHAHLLVRQLEQGCGLPEVIGCHHPLYQNRYVVRHGKTAYELRAYSHYKAGVALPWERIFWICEIANQEPT